MSIGTANTLPILAQQVGYAASQNLLSQAIQGHIDLSQLMNATLASVASAQMALRAPIHDFAKNNLNAGMNSLLQDLLEHGKIDAENIGLAMIGASTQYGLAEYDKKITAEKNITKKPDTNRLNQKTPLSQKEISDVKQTQQKIQSKTNTKKPPVKSSWNPHFGDDETTQDAKNIFGEMVQESFSYSDEPNGAQRSRQANDAQIAKASNKPIKSLRERIVEQEYAEKMGRASYYTKARMGEIGDANDEAHFAMGYYGARAEEKGGHIALAEIDLITTAGLARDIGIFAIKTAGKVMTAGRIIKNTWPTGAETLSMARDTLFGRSGLVEMRGSVGEVGKKAASSENLGGYRVPRKLPVDKHGNPIPDLDLPHTQLGEEVSSKGYKYAKAREWGYGEKGRLVRKKEIDFTNHGRSDHPNPHQHVYTPNPTGGTFRRGGAEALTFGKELEKWLEKTI